MSVNDPQSKTDMTGGLPEFDEMQRNGYSLSEVFYSI